MSEDQETYVRKIDSGAFEFGFVKRFKNFRKRPNIYTPVGVRLTVAEAEEAREAIGALRKIGAA